MYFNPTLPLTSFAFSGSFKHIALPMQPEQGTCSGLKGSCFFSLLEISQSNHLSVPTSLESCSDSRYTQHLPAQHWHCERRGWGKSCAGLGSRAEGCSWCESFLLKWKPTKWLSSSTCTWNGLSAIVEISFTAFCGEGEGGMAVWQPPCADLVRSPGLVGKPLKWAVYEMSWWWLSQWWTDKW